jgi:hypothetical protein
VRRIREGCLSGIGLTEEHLRDRKQNAPGKSLAIGYLFENPRRGASGKRAASEGVPMASTPSRFPPWIQQKRRDEMRFIKAFQPLMLCMVISLLGCVGQPTVTKEEPVSTPAAEELPTGDVAGLYIFNTSGWTLIPEDQPVLDNGKDMVSLPRNTYAKIMIAAGEHTLGFPERQKPNLTLDAAKGETYYVLVAYTPQSSWAFHYFTDPIIIKQISEAEAIALMKELALQQPQ